MYEVLEVILKVVLLFGLFYIAWFDYRTKMIEIKWLLVLGMTGLGGLLLRWELPFVMQTFGGMLVGVVLLILAWISEENVGFGDGWLFVVTGAFLGFWENFVLFFGSMILAGVFAIICVGLKKKGRNDRVALAPFVLTAYVVFVL